MRYLIFTMFILCFLAFGDNHANLLSTTSDAKFGGYYLNIERSMQRLKATRLQVHEIQNQMRDALEANSGSLSRLSQQPYVQRALTNAINNVMQRRVNQGEFRPMRFGRRDFLVVLDLDETLLTHWYRLGDGNGANRRATLTPTVRDSVPNVVDNEGNSIRQPELLLSPNAVAVRPGVTEFFRTVSALPGFRGFVLFTAKEDRSAWDLYRVWKQKNPALFRHVKGFYTRNYLRFDGNLRKPSKDLRMFDPSLEHIILIDDNESRVIQSQFNYTIPKYNADKYLPSRNREVLRLNERLLGHVASLIRTCTQRTRERLHTCFRRMLGELKPNGELTQYLEHYRRQTQSRVTAQWIQREAIFAPPFHVAFRRRLTEPFPRFRNFQLQ